MSVEPIESSFINLELEDVTCNICFYVNQEPFKFGPCRHTLCAGCSSRWLGTSPDCPMCRRPVEYIEMDEELQRKAAEFLKCHPESEIPSDIKWKQNCYETVFWAIQQRSLASDQGAVFFGRKPQIPKHLNEKGQKEFLQSVRAENIWKRLEVLKSRIGEQTELLQQIYQDELRNRIFRNVSEEVQEWRIVPGRGLLRVHRPTNRYHCPLRFRRSHSS